jgi:hypothetical protein
MEEDQVVDPPPPKQMRTTSVQAGNGEDIIDNYLYTANPILMTCSNETDILVSQQKIIITIFQVDLNLQLEMLIVYVYIYTLN